MKLIFLMMLAGIARAERLQTEIPQKCMDVARQYANEHGGEPWSDDANFVRTVGNSCLVRVSQTCDKAPYLRYNKTYNIDMVTWTVSYFEVDGCVDGP
ncbi:MAG: hypothetical protein AB7G93_21095 [Bdellovibrionales bacterium]